MIYHLFLVVAAFILSCSGNNEKNELYDENGISFHFDLSDIETDEEKSLFLNVNGKKYKLKSHFEDSRKLLLEEGNQLEYQEKEKLTHFATGIEMDKEAVEHIYITEGNPHTDTDHRLLMSFHHLIGKDDNDDHEYGCAVSAAVSLVFNHPELVTRDAEKAEIIMRHINPVDPDRMCDPKAEHRQEIIDLAVAMNTAYKNGEAYISEPLEVSGDDLPENSSERKMHWVENGEDNEPSLIMYRDGKPFHVYGFTEDGTSARPYAGDTSEMTEAVRYRPADSILDAAEPALTVALNETKNDPRLEDIKYTVITGKGPAEKASDLSAPSEESNTVNAAVKYSDTEKIILSKSGGMDGMSMEIDEISDTSDGNDFRNARIKVKNYYLRHVALWLKWKSPDGNYDKWWKNYPAENSSILDFYEAVGIDGWYEWFHDASKTDDSVFWGFVSNRSVIMGVPLSPDWTYFDIPIPSSSSSVELIFASMGTGKWQNENIPGALLTSVIDLGIPAYFLASGVREGPEGEPLLKDALTDPKVLLAVISTGLALGIYGEAESEGASNYKSYAKALGAILTNTGCDRLRYAIVELTAESEAENALPFVGWGLYLAGLAADTSQLTQTVTEVASTPATLENGIAATWSPTVRIFPDENNIRGGFPESASKYEAYIFFGKHRTGKISGTIANTAVPLMDFTFRDIPEGGNATVVINLLSESGFVAGNTALDIKNTLKAAPPDSDGVNYSTEINENMVNITSNTEFIHKDRIGLDSEGNHIWMGHSDGEGNYVAPPAPEKTAADLNCSTEEGGLCSLGGITLNIKGHSAGYSWQSHTDDKPVCDSGQNNPGQRYFVENISLLGNEAGGPESSFFENDCGYVSYRPELVYKLNGETDGNNLFIYPENDGSGKKYYAQKIETDNDISFDETDRAAGFLSLPPTDAAVHPGGYLVSVNREYSKMEILDLNRSQYEKNEAPAARIVLGEGDRTGLISRPSAVAVTEKGDILILEKGNMRISAFDIRGSVREIFGDKNSSGSHLEIEDADDTAELLDMDVDSTGLIFVLMYENGGSDVKDYTVQIYSETGTLLDKVQGVAAGKMAVDHFRNIFTLNYETLSRENGTIKPSISLWTPVP